MIADMEANKKLSTIIIELFIKGRKINISSFFRIKIRSPKTYKIEQDTLFYHENT